MQSRDFPGARPRCRSRRLWRGAGAALIALALSSGVAQATVYYVDNSCTTGGTGRSPVCNQSDGPFRSIAAAMGAPLAPGDVIKVRATAQAYTEATVTTPVAGTSVAPIVITRYDGDTGRPVWRASSDELVNFTRAYWVVEHVEMDGNGVGADIISVNAQNVTVRDCVIHNNTNDAVSIGAAGDDFTISDCEIYDVGAGGDRHAITTGRESGDAINYVVTGVRILNNVIHDIGGDCIQFLESSGDCRVATVTGLIDGNVMRKGSRVGHENAIDVKTKALANDPLIISRNVITGWDGSSTAEGNRAVVIQHCADYAKFRYNFVQSDGPGNEGLSCNPCMGVNVSASTATAATPVVGVEVVGNTFVGMRDAIEIGDGTSQTAHRDLKVLHNTAYRVSRAMFRIKGPVTQGEFRNNLSASGPGVSCSSGGDLTGSVWSHNGWFGDASQQSSCSGCSVGNLCDATDVRGSDPLFVNPAAGDFRLQSTSPCIDRGTPVGLPYLGAAPDLGAQEFQGALADIFAPAAIRDLIGGP